MDPSLRNWGLCSAVYDTASKALSVNYVKTVCPALSPNKQIRQNSLDLESAAQLSGEACQAAHETDAVFVEVPVGSQSARAMASYGICVGVLGALRAGGTTFFEVNPTEVKMASFGSKTATKQEMIDWATAKHPEANWPTVKRNGKSAVSSAKAEHMADALATIYAGIASQPFQQLLTFMSQQNNRSPYGHSIQAASN
jgi:Holliday junction resolvasome RuvABC endonuclease subunit